MKQLNNIVDNIMYLMNEMNYKECSVSLSRPFKNPLRTGISLSNTHLYPAHLLCIVSLNVLYVLLNYAIYAFISRSPSLYCLFKRSIRSSKLRHLRFPREGRFPFLIPSIAVSLMACWSFRTRMKYHGEGCLTPTALPHLIVCAKLHLSVINIPHSW